jgi:hypothetical protein
MSARTLLDATQGYQPEHFRGTIDGDSLPQSPWQRYASGRPCPGAVAGWLELTEVPYQFSLRDQPPTVANYQAAVQAVLATTPPTYSSTMPLTLTPQ